LVVSLRSAYWHIIIAINYNNFLSQFFRLLVDVQGLYNLKKANEWCSLEDFVFFATANSDHLPCDRLMVNVVPYLAVRIAGFFREGKFSRIL